MATVVLVRDSGEGQPDEKIGKDKNPAQQSDLTVIQRELRLDRLDEDAKDLPIDMIKHVGGRQQTEIIIFAIGGEWTFGLAIDG